MSIPSPSNKIEVGSVSDRGLSEKRPLNEDSFLADAGRGIFVVADGVGGAEAGMQACQSRWRPMPRAGELARARSIASSPCCRT